MGTDLMRAPPALLAQPDLRLWLDLGVERTLGVRTGKVELGQGILTALAQIAAQELCVPPSWIVVKAASTLDSPDEGFTAGSLSVEYSGAALRFAGACLRERLVAAAADRLAASRHDLQVRDGVVCQGENATDWSYWTLADELLRLPVTDDLEVRLAQPTRHDGVGADLPRVDLAAKLVGGAFIQDLELPGMRHAKVLRQPFARAKLMAPDLEQRMRERLPDATLIRSGDFVACVADSEVRAGEALQRLQKIARWQPADAATVPSGTTDIGSDLATWLAQQPSHDTVLEPRTAPAGAARVSYQGTWSRPFLAHASIGLCCALAREQAGRLEVWTHSQGIFPLRDQLARVLQRPAASVVVHHIAGAGCYGHNGADDVALDAALVAVALPGTPIRIQWSREEELSQAPFGAAMAVTIEATLDADDRINSWCAHVSATSHGTRPGMHGDVNLLAAGALDPGWLPPRSADVPEAVGGGASRNARPIYAVGARALTLRLVDSPVRSSALRSLGAYANVFAIEGMMDELAAAAAQDAAAFRRRHLSDERALAVLDRVVAMSGWNERANLDGGTTLGLGLAQYKGRAAYCAVVVEIELEQAVAVRRVWCAVDAGRLINPDGARNQIEGGIVQSISWTLKEAVRFDGTTPLCTGWDGYPVLRFGEVPLIETEFLGATDNPAVGVGEASQGPTAAALGNAVSTALGLRARHLPLDRDALVALLSLQEAP